MKTFLVAQQYKLKVVSAMVWALKRTGRDSAVCKQNGEHWKARVIKDEAQQHRDAVFRGWKTYWKEEQSTREGTVIEVLQLNADHLGGPEHQREWAPRRTWARWEFRWNA